MSDHPQGWIGVDLDGTLAEYHGWPADGSIGAPIPAMVDRVKLWLVAGIDVRIVTARVSGQEFRIGSARWTDAMAQKQRIKDWCSEHLGKELCVTYKKNYQMLELWDDRAIQVRPNTGERVEDWAYARGFAAGNAAAHGRGDDLAVD